MSKTIQFSAQIDGVKLKKDRTLEIKLGTQELAPEETSLIFDLGEKQIWCALAETVLTENDLNIPESLTEFKDDKTPSKRLRNTFYVYWSKNFKGKQEWDSWYKGQMEKIIDFVKEKLD